LNEDGTGGHDPTAIGPGQKKLPRHAPQMWNVAYLPALYWDGRADSLEAQATGAWAGGNMGVGKENLQKKADEIGLKPEYEPLFADAFPGEGATPDTIVKAIAAYERTLTCADTAWDKFSAGDAAALDEEQKKGWELFRGDKAGCASCHTPPFFSDAVLAAGGAYHNAGVGLEGKKEGEADVGRQAISKSESDFGAFKTPSLRNISKTAPYFHDGSVATLEAAVRFMAGGGYKNKNLDPKFVDRKLSDAEIKSLVAFLGALACEGTLTPPAN
jgi:cytochrome c peroxidase